MRYGLKAVGVLGLGVLMMPGCIAWEIRDELRKTNEQLTTRLSMLEKTNDALQGIQSDLSRTNDMLTEVKAELAKTNGLMDDVHTRLAVLDSINKSLVSLEDSLKTVKGLIEKIPFVGASDEEEEKPAEEPAAPAPSGETSR